jgi:membrane protein DedA with SNARE-associated domain
VTAEHAIWLFAWVALNQGGVPIPVVPSLVAAGALASAGHAKLLSIVAVIVGGTLVADLVWYGIGRWRGAQIIALLGRLSRRTVERLHVGEQYFVAHQVGFMLCSRFLPEVNPVAAGMAGAAHLPPGRYMLIATVSAVAWAATWTGAGYAACSVAICTSLASADVAMILLLTSLIISSFLTLKHRRRARPCS